MKKTARILVASAALLWAGGAAALARVPSTIELDAQARARGNDRPAAVALAGALLAHPWAAQITQVRVDRAGSHAVAGVVLSGVKFKAPVGAGEFLRQAQEIVALALRTTPVEEVDLWTTIPLDAGVGAVTSGDFAKPTARTVFTLTVRRAASERTDAVLGAGVARGHRSNGRERRDEPRSNRAARA